MKVFRSCWTVQSLYFTQIRHVRGGGGAKRVVSHHHDDDMPNDDLDSSTTGSWNSKKEEFYDSALSEKRVNRQSSARPTSDRLRTESASIPKVKRLLEDAAGFVDLKQSPLDDGPRVSTSKAPYPKYGLNAQTFSTRDQTKFSYRPSTVRARDTSIILFPGQGSQYVGMGKKLVEYPTVKHLFGVANEILGFDLMKLCLNGPASELKKTAFCQPAVFVTSMAAVERLREDKPQFVENCIATAGFSVGEYAALVLAGSLSFEDALKLVKVRADAMQRASELTPSGLLTVFLKHSSKLDLAMEGACEWAKEHGKIENPVCKVANYLFTNCKVIGGHEEALKFVETHATKFNLLVERVRNVDVALHTPLVRPSTEAVKDQLMRTTIKSPTMYAYSGQDGKCHRYAFEIAKQLAQEPHSPVGWSLVMNAIYGRVFDWYELDELPTTFECGPGDFLCHILKHTNATAAKRYRNVCDE